MANLKPNDQRAKKAILLIWIVLGINIISMISSYFQYDLLQAAREGEQITMEIAEATDLRDRMIALIYLVVFIISTVTFIQWFRRAYFNLHQNVPSLAYSEGWAAGAWFVPFVNLHRPYKIMKELYEKTQTLLVRKKLGTYEMLNTDYLVWWWSFWLFNNFAANAVTRYTMQAETLDALTNATLADMWVHTIELPLALLAIKVIQDYAKVEPLLWEIQDDETTSATDNEQNNSPE